VELRGAGSVTFAEVVMPRILPPLALLVGSLFDLKPFLRPDPRYLDAARAGAVKDARLRAARLVLDGSEHLPAERVGLICCPLAANLANRCGSKEHADGAIGYS